ncbi:MAG: hypothetical protein ACXAC7_00095 [Candidatus Hodarchaeales archaeon]
MNKIKLNSKISNSASKEKKTIIMNKWNSIELVKDKSFPNTIPIKLPFTIIGKWEVSEERCRISWQKLTPQTTVRCPSCKSAFHKKYWLDWIYKKHFCPVCKVTIET